MYNMICSKAEVCLNSECFHKEPHSQNDGCKSPNCYIFQEENTICKEISKFQVNDKVRCRKIEDAYWDGDKWIKTYFYQIGEELIIKELTKEGKLRFNERSYYFYNPDCFEKVEEAKVSRYNEIKKKIEELQNGWNKEADDIIIELDLKNKFLIAVFYCSDTSGRICIYNAGQDTFQPWKIDCIIYSKFGISQCEKFDAFKKALLWLLDHSNIKKDKKQEKIEQLEIQMKDIQKQIEELKK